LKFPFGFRIKEAQHGAPRTVSGQRIEEVPGDVAFLLARVTGYAPFLVRSPGQKWIRIHFWILMVKIANAWGL